jgi:hypothetical protein
LKGEKKMTAPSTAKKSTAAKEALSVSKEENTQPSNTEVAPVETPRISKVLNENPILVQFCEQFLAVKDEIAAYNKDILAESDSEWNVPKVLAKARELGSPTDANVPANESIKNALTEWEKLVSSVNVAKRKVVELTAKEIGVTLSATAERNPQLEAPMRDRRAMAVEIGKNLDLMKNMVQDKATKDALTAFLQENELPAIGRDQSRKFGESEKSTPKYRVNVVVTKDGEEIVKESGFTNTALALPKYYERGKSIKSETLREVWEKAGNTGEKTVQPVVEFEDNGLHFVITKK